MPCGLHIIGTERHESRRIDNQLRGRSGRQGDPGSSRFFLSLGDDLLRMFMGEWMLKMLEKMGFEEGMAIEAKSISKGIERAQKKVEEKNFGIRKHLLEYDEVMDHQRKIFYSQRQEILAAARPGRSGKLVQLIWKMIDNTIDNAAEKFLAPNYSARCICDWARAELECNIEPRNLDIHDPVSIDKYVRAEAAEEAHNQINMTVGEYMDPDLDPKQWDIRGLARWAETRFGSKISQNQLRQMSLEEVQEHLVEASDQKIEDFDLSPTERYMDPDYGRKTLLAWAQWKFGVELGTEGFEELTHDEIVEKLDESIKDAYRDREARYPVEWILERTVLNDTIENAYAADALAQWANGKFNLGWTVDDVQKRPTKDVAEELFRLNREYAVNGQLQKEIDHAKSQAAGADEGKLGEWGKQRFGPAFDDETFNKAEDPGEALLTFGRDLLRRELSPMTPLDLPTVRDGGLRRAWRGLADRFPPPAECEVLDDLPRFWRPLEREMRPIALPQKAARTSVELLARRRYRGHR